MAKTHERQLAKEPTAAQCRAALAARLMAERIHTSDLLAAQRLATLDPRQRPPEEVPMR